MVRKLLTDARETSYWILSSRLTAECSTIELPGNGATHLFSLKYRRRIHATSSGVRHGSNIVIFLNGSMKCSFVLTDSQKLIL
jgi:hypothetical protein